MDNIFRTIFNNRPLAIVVGGFLLTIATFIANIVLSYEITSNLKLNVNKVESIYNELSVVSQLESDLSFAENSLKNYNISRQGIYLRSHERSIKRINSDMVVLLKAKGSGLVSSTSLNKLELLIGERKEIFKNTKFIIQFKDAKTASELISQGSDKTLEIRELLQNIENELKVSLQINRKYIDRSINYGSYTNYLAICIALVVAFFATISITQDYLRQKEIERILRQLNDDKTKLFSILGHDLRSPLSGINAVIYILKNHYASLTESEVKEYIESLEQTSLNYGKLLEDVLTWSRLQLDKIQIDPQVYDLKLICQEVIDLYTDHLISKKLKMVNLIPSTQTLKVDKIMFQTVVRNLISNAIKFTNQNGEIRLHYREDKDFNYIDVADSGVGMSAAVIRTLFTNSTISMAGTENEVGTGLGLAICKEFLRKEGGDLDVSSKEGEGSVFTIVIPKEQMVKKNKGLARNVLSKN
jgi:signal transduction histidine kinase